MSKTELDMSKPPEDLSHRTILHTSIDDATASEMAFWESVYRDVISGIASRSIETSYVVSDSDRETAAITATTAVLRRRLTFPHLTP